MSCVSGFEISTEGDATLIVGSGGAALTLHADSTTVSFHGGGGHYQSFPMPFPVRDPDDNTVFGTVTFEIVSADESRIEGFVHWQALGCQGDYPFDMDLAVPFGLSAETPQEGTWILEWVPICQTSSGAVIGAEALPGMIPPTATMAVSGGGAANLSALFSFSGASVMLSQIGNPSASNFYGSPFGSTYLGVAVDPVTSVAGPIMGGFTGALISPTQFVGSFILSGGCNGGGSFSMTWIGP